MRHEKSVILAIYDSGNISILYFEICPNVVFDISILKLILISNEHEIDIHEFPLMQIFESDTDSSMV